MKSSHEDTPVPGTSRPRLPDLKPFFNLPMLAQVTNEDNEKETVFTPDIILSVATMRSLSTGKLHAKSLPSPSLTSWRSHLQRFTAVEVTIDGL